MGEWHRRLIAETRALQGLSPNIEDDPVNVELAVRLLTSPASALSPSPAAPAGRDGGDSGAAGPRDTDDAAVRGSAASVVNVGRSGGNRPAAPSTTKARPAATGRAKKTAAR